MLKFKYKVNGLRIQMVKLKMILSLGALTGVFYVRALLKKIQLAKEIFVQTIEEGHAVLIPPEL